MKKLIMGLIVVSLLLVPVACTEQAIEHPWPHAKGPGVGRAPPRPAGSWVVAMEVEYLLGGKESCLTISENGTVIYIQEKGLRPPRAKHVKIRREGQLTKEELSSLIEFFKESGFDELSESYAYQGNPMSDRRLTVFIDYQDMNKTVTAFGYLTREDIPPYLDMPYPLNEIYKRLKHIAENRTEEIHRETIKD